MLCGIEQGCLGNRILEILLDAHMYGPAVCMILLVVEHTGHAFGSSTLGLKGLCRLRIRDVYRYTGSCL